MSEAVAVKCGRCLWSGRRKRPFARPCPKCGGSVVLWAERGVYLLCLRNPDGSKGWFGHAGHYLGYSDQMSRRLDHHRNGTGSNFMRHVTAAGLDFWIARVWPGASRTEERSKHGTGGKRKRCPLCLLDSQSESVLVLHDIERRETAV